MILAEPARFYRVVIIGAGTTGTAVARDLALRGISDILVIEKGDVACATTGRCHSNLHSGMRYILTDLKAAIECVQENTILRRIAPHTVDPGGCLWIAVDEEMEEYASKARGVARQIGLPLEEVDPAEAMRLEPLISRRTRLTLRSTDAGFDPFRLAVSQLMDAVNHGATFMNHTMVEAIVVRGGAVKGCIIRNLHNGHRQEINCDIIINAAGPWSGLVARMAGIDIPVKPNKGTMAVYNLRLTTGIVALLRPPGDGDGLVSLGYQSTTLLGTSSVDVEDPEDPLPTLEEIELMESHAVLAVPAVRSARILRAFSGVRPLYSKKGERGREISRSTTLIDHQAEHGLKGLITVTGGKYATARLMGERAADVACQKLGVAARCVTHEHLLPGAAPREDVIQIAKKLRSTISIPYYALHKLAARYGNTATKLVGGKEHLVCECSKLLSSEINHAFFVEQAVTMDDIRRRTRLGMGTCQGTFCSFQAAAILVRECKVPIEKALRDLLAFLEERWKGMRYALQAGDGWAQAELLYTFYIGVGCFDQLAPSLGFSQITDGWVS